ncbi:MAG TPA: class I SAM-dependent methyltransferase [Candidatus Ratteibacteria bacterium]|nr:class I SAM-dependent methyltransferase [Candidatus Ratteibacteria bacterium]
MVKCPICKSRSRLIWKEKKHKVFRCKNCKVAFLYPIPESSEKIYNRKYFENWYLRYYDERKRYFEKLFNNKLKNYLPEQGKILDVGCGVGIFLDIMREKKYDVYGQDISPFAVEYCRKNGFNIFDKSLSELNLPENFFDIVTMFDVIAHLKNPVKYIKICKRILKPEGILIIKTPYHSACLFLLANIFSFTGKSKGLLHIPAQIFHFSYKTFEYMSKNFNFSKIFMFNIREFFPDIISISLLKKFVLNEKSIIFIGKNKK